MEWEAELTGTRKLIEFIYTAVLISKTSVDEDGSHFDGTPRWNRICARFLNRLYPFMIETQKRIPIPDLALFFLNPCYEHLGFRQKHVMGFLKVIS